MTDLNNHKVSNNVRPLARQLASDMSIEEIEQVNGADLSANELSKSGVFTKVHLSYTVDYDDSRDTD